MLEVCYWPCLYAAVVNLPTDGTLLGVSASTFEQNMAETLWLAPS